MDKDPSGWGGPWLLAFRDNTALGERSFRPRKSIMIILQDDEAIGGVILLDGEALSWWSFRQGDPG